MKKEGQPVRPVRNAYFAQWNKQNTRNIKFKFHLRTDADVIARLESQENIQGYIKALIRADIARNGIPVKKPE